MTKCDMIFATCSIKESNATDVCFNDEMYYVRAISDVVVLTPEEFKKLLWKAHVFQSGNATEKEMIDAFLERNDIKL